MRNFIIFVYDNVQHKAGHYCLKQKNYPSYQHLYKQHPYNIITNILEVSDEDYLQFNSQ